jgi:hypothetical protein
MKLYSWEVDSGIALCVTPATPSMMTVPRCRMPCQWMLAGCFRLFFTLHITAVVAVHAALWEAACQLNVELL